MFVQKTEKNNKPFMLLPVIDAAPLIGILPMNQKQNKKHTTGSVFAGTMTPHLRCQLLKPINLERYDNV